MADKNKLFLGTNKDTYIAADDTGSIVFQNENGTRAVLDAEGLKVGLNNAIPAAIGGGGDVDLSNVKGLNLNASALDLGAVTAIESATTGELIQFTTDINEYHWEVILYGPGDAGLFSYSDAGLPADVMPSIGDKIRLSTPWREEEDFVFQVSYIYDNTDIELVQITGPDEAGLAYMVGDGNLLYLDKTETVDKLICSNDIKIDDIDYYISKDATSLTVNTPEVVTYANDEGLLVGVTNGEFEGTLRFFSLAVEKVSTDVTSIAPGDIITITNASGAKLTFENLIAADWSDVPHYPGNLGYFDTDGTVISLDPGFFDEAEQFNEIPNPDGSTATLYVIPNQDTITFLVEGLAKSSGVIENKNILSTQNIFSIGDNIYLHPISSLKLLQNDGETSKDIIKYSPTTDLVHVQANSIGTPFESTYEDPYVLSSAGGRKHNFTFSAYFGGYNVIIAAANATDSNLLSQAPFSDDVYFSDMNNFETSEKYKYAINLNKLFPRSTFENAQDVYSDQHWSAVAEVNVIATQYTGTFYTYKDVWRFYRSYVNGPGATEYNVMKISTTATQSAGEFNFTVQFHVDSAGDNWISFVPQSNDNNFDYIMADVTFIG